MIMQGMLLGVDPRLPIDVAEIEGEPLNRLAFQCLIDREDNRLPVVGAGRLSRIADFHDSSDDNLIRFRDEQIESHSHRMFLGAKCDWRAKNKNRGED